MSPTKMDIFRLSLVGDCELAAKEFAQAHPDAVFTSGRRTKEEQASAMASHVAADHLWIVKTYRPSDAALLCQHWVTANPLAKSEPEIAAGLLSVLDGLTDEQCKQLSRHFEGKAFDVRPVGGLHGSMMLATLRLVVKKYGGILLESEGGIRLWHAQFP